MASLTVTQFSVRFYGELNDFLPRHKRHRTFPVAVKGRPSVKDAVEALGVPHPEIDIILVNRRSITFKYQMASGDRVSVYPEGFNVNVSPLIHLRPRNVPARFVIDSHLGKLVRHLRLLGFDCVYRKDFPDAEIVRIAETETRIVLTRDIGLLKNRAVRAGLWVRSPDPRYQLKEVLKKYRLLARIRPFRRCLECNGRITCVAKKDVLGQLPDMVKQTYSRFYSCRSCRKVYWKGSHYDQLSGLTRRLQAYRRPG